MGTSHNSHSRHSGQTSSALTWCHSETQGQRGECIWQCHMLCNQKTQRKVASPWSERALISRISPVCLYCLMAASAQTDAGFCHTCHGWQHGRTQRNQSWAKVTNTGEFPPPSSSFNLSEPRTLSPGCSWENLLYVYTVVLCSCKDLILLFKSFSLIYCDT